MHLSAGTLRIAAFVLAAATVGCASQAQHSSTRLTVCYPRQCYIDVQNDNGAILAARYYDSTGIGDVLGLVQSGAVRRFILPRRTSRTITVEVSFNKQVYRSQARLLLPPLENVFHFPADFEPALLAGSSFR